MQSRLRLTAALLIALIGCIPAAVEAITFDFESETATSAPPTGAYTSLAMTEGGLTLTLSRSTGAAFDVVLNVLSLVDDQSGKPPGWATKSLDPFFTLPAGNFWIGTFSILVGEVKVQYGDYGPSDTDSPVFLKAWSGPGGTGSLLDSDTGTWAGIDSFPDYGSLVVFGSGIQSITFGSLASGDFPNSLFWDNISVPEPASLLLLGAGFAALASRRMRRP